MNKIFLILGLISIQGIALAQVNTQSYMSVNIGASLPSGEYAEADFDNSNAGYANAGPDVSIEGVFFFMDYVGIGGKTGANLNFFGKTRFRNDLINNHGAEDVEFYSSFAYLNIYSVLGLYFNIPVTEKFHITPKILAGAMISETPYTDIDIYYENGDYENYYSDGALSAGFATMFGLDLRYVVTERFMIKANFERLAAKQAYNYDIYGSYIGRQQKVNLYSITVSAGLAF